MDASMLDTFQSCSMKYKLRYKDSIEAEGKDKDSALDRGDVFHVGEEQYWNVLKNTSNWELAVQEGLKHFKVALSKTDFETEEGEWFIKTYIDYKEYWKREDRNFQIFDIEKAFSYVLWEDKDASIRIVMIGKIDWTGADSRWPFLIMDHKSYAREFPIRRWQNQGPNYCLALGVDVIYFNRIGLQKSYPPEKKFKRIPITYDALILEEWRMNTVKWCLKYLECEQANDWEYNQTSCDKFNRLCEYYEDYCNVSGREAKEYKLITNFKSIPKWDPSKSLLSKSKLAGIS